MKYKIGDLILIKCDNKIMEFEIYSVSSNGRYGLSVNDRCGFISVYENFIIGLKDNNKRLNINC